LLNLGGVPPGGGGGGGGLGDGDILNTISGKI
jgi:hypothetical protein